jgi:hypothetical protein
MTAAQVAHTDWCDGRHTRDGVKRCTRWIGAVQAIHVYVSGAVGEPPQVLVDGALSRLNVSDAQVLHGLIGEAIRIAGGEPAEVEP